MEGRFDAYEGRFDAYIILNAFADKTVKAFLVRLLQIYEQITANMKAADATTHLLLSYLP